ncbi:MAG: hypothetical protein FWD57_09925 [Polyangiaceae bacterium]|nr:hypothetical protein [Polyangiaceae bacterium]
MTTATRAVAGNAVPVSVMPAADEDTSDGETTYTVTNPAFTSGQQL